MPSTGGWKLSWLLHCNGVPELLLLSTERGAKGSHGSGAGYRSFKSIDGAGFRLMRGWRGVERAEDMVGVGVQGDSWLTRLVPVLEYVSRHDPSRGGFIKHVPCVLQSVLMNVAYEAKFGWCTCASWLPVAS